LAATGRLFGTNGDHCDFALSRGGSEATELWHWSKLLDPMEGRLTDSKLSALETQQREKRLTEETQLREKLLAESISAKIKTEFDKMWLTTDRAFRVLSWTLLSGLLYYFAKSTDSMFLRAIAGAFIYSIASTFVLMLFASLPTNVIHRLARGILTRKTRVTVGWWFGITLVPLALSLTAIMYFIIHLIELKVIHG
jgi:hypothetical protein